MPLPYIIASENVNGREHPTAMNVWLALSNLGDAYGLLISLLVVYGLHWNWSVSMFLYSFLFLVSCFANYFVLEEVEVEAKDTSHAVQTLKDHYTRQASNPLLLCDYLMTSCIRAMFIFWLTYFFDKLGFKE